MYCPAFNDRAPCLIHAHFGVDGVAALPLAKKLDVPLLTTFHGYDATTKNSDLLRSKSPTLIRYALLKNKLANDGAKFICVSKFIQSKVLELGFPENKTVLHYMGTNVDELISDEIRAESTAPIILHVARLVEKKGTSDLLTAFKRAIEVCPDAQLVIIGDGPLRTRLIGQAEALGITHKVSFLGVQPHTVVKEWLTKAAIFALPSITASNGDTEGLPISIIEAAASGLPIVATIHSGIPEAVEHGRGGLLSAERDIGKLAESLIELLRSQSLRRALGSQAREYVKKNFDVKQQSLKLERIYEAIL
jgi:glycosyltransferase involved in cell wall biosynthesis